MLTVGKCGVKLGTGKMRLLLAVTFEFLAILAQISSFFFWHFFCYLCYPTHDCLAWFGGVYFLSFSFCALLPENNVTCINN